MTLAHVAAVRSTNSAVVKIPKNRGGDMRRELSFPVPFCTQRVTEDSWQSDGFVSFQDGDSWQLRGCGIASLRMVVDAYLQQGCPNATCGGQGSMIYKGVEKGAYKPGVGWIHKGLADMAEEYGLQGTAYRGKTAEQLAEEISKDHPCIVSVTPRFAGGTMNEKTGMPWSTGGHLVVVYGFETDDNGELCAFLTHHSSCFQESNTPDWRVGIDAFRASFSSNFIVFEKPNENPMNNDNE